jgi:serine/threonine protein kinase/tetratricopeptide (TPR) repeat protein
MGDPAPRERGALLAPAVGPHLTWDAASEAFTAALEAPPERREEVARALCGGRQRLVDEVLSLLAAHREAERFLEDPAARLLVADEPPLPESIGPYRILGELGRGGMGRVLLAERADEVFHKTVAIKLLGVRPSPRILALFARERQILADLEHPNVARILDGGNLPDGRPFLVMEHVDGRRIDEYCAARRLSGPDRLRLFLRVCDGVDAAHRALVVHGDIKPANVLVTSEGIPKLIDFGVSGSLDDPAPADGATPEYASPEQIRGERLTAAADVHSLGVLLFDLLTGAPAATRAGDRACAGSGRAAPDAARPRFDIGDRLAAALSGPDRAAMSGLRRAARGDLRHVLARALASHPSDRYASVQELAVEVRRLLAGEVVAAAPRTLWHLLRSHVSRHPIATALVAVTGAFLCVALLLALMVRREARAEAARVREQLAVGNEILHAARRDALLPVHDRAPFVRAVREKMRASSELVGSGAGQTRGAAAYAVACGALSLGEYDDARRHLELAVEEEVAPDEVRLLLAQTLLMLYGEAVGRLEGEGSLTGREPELAALDERYRAPAVRHLGPPASGPAARYQAALLAYHRGAAAEAAAMAQAAFAAAPWLYEAKQLEAEALLAMARAAGNAGDFDAEQNLLRRAGESYEAGLAVARSAVPLWVGECARRARVFDGATTFGPQETELMSSTYEWALQPCRTALAIDPETQGAHVGMAQIHWRRADGLVRSRIDPTAVAQQAVVAAERAIALRPHDGAAHRVLGLAHVVHSRWVRARTPEVEARLARAEAALRRAVALDPRSAPAATALGNALYTQSYIAMGDPAGDSPLGEAIRWYERAVALAPHDPKHRSNLGTALLAKAGLERDRGARPFASLAAARAAFAIALELAPEDFIALGNGAQTHQMEAMYLVDTGGDPTAALDAAEAGFLHLLRARPGVATTHYGLAVNHRYRAISELRRGADPRRPLRAGREALREERRLVPRAARRYRLEAELELVEALWRIETGRDPGAPLARAMNLLERPDGIAPRGPCSTRAQAYWLRGRWLLARGGDPRPAVAAGLEALDGAEPTPQAAPWRGALLALRAATSGSAADLAAAERVLQYAKGSLGVPPEVWRYVASVADAFTPTEATPVARKT